MDFLIFMFLLAGLAIFGMLIHRHTHRTARRLIDRLGDD
jgi:hypothetical protein